MSYDTRVVLLGALTDANDCNVAARLAVNRYVPSLLSFSVAAYVQRFFDVTTLAVYARTSFHA